MCIILQSYKFESNSQPCRLTPASCRRCVLSYKVTNLKAIHNRCWGRLPRRRDVYYPTKLQIWKQFTTAARWWGQPQRMCIILQSYKFESNSQHSRPPAEVALGCVLSYKVTNLKAIHNIHAVYALLKEDVYYPTKLQIWKQFTTEPNNGRKHPEMCIILQSYKFESNSQLLLVAKKVKLMMCIILQSYKFESNSQPRTTIMLMNHWCVLSYKVTNLKAIHNYREPAKYAKVGCVLSYKVTNLKAIHNTRL